MTPDAGAAPAAPFFRAGVGAVITNARGAVLALERADVPGAWQCPQGGLDAGEEPARAVLREIEEETGIPPRQLELVARCPEPLAYCLPPALRSAKTGLGQVQFWFLFRYHGPEAIPLPASGEFRAWAWRPFARVVAEVVEFKRPVYKRLQACFGDRLAG